MKKHLKTKWKCDFQLLSLLSAAAIAVLTRVSPLAHSTLWLYVKLPFNNVLQDCNNSVIVLFSILWIVIKKLEDS